MVRNECDVPTAVFYDEKPIWNNFNTSRLNTPRQIAVLTTFQSWIQHSVVKKVLNINGNPTGGFSRIVLHMQMKCAAPMWFHNLCDSVDYVTVWNDNRYGMSIMYAYNKKMDIEKILRGIRVKRWLYNCKSVVKAKLEMRLTDEVFYYFSKEGRLGISDCLPQRTLAHGLVQVIATVLNATKNCTFNSVSVVIPAGEQCISLKFASNKRNELEMDMFYSPNETSVLLKDHTRCITNKSCMFNYTFFHDSNGTFFGGYSSSGGKQQQQHSTTTESEHQTCVVILIQTRRKLSCKSIRATMLSVFDVLCVEGGGENNTKFDRRYLASSSATAAATASSFINIKKKGNNNN